MEDDFYISQDAFFLGFPYGLNMGSGKINNNYPFPFVKKCIFSAIDNTSTPHLIYLDGHNNHGFSGGPVCYFSSKTKQIHIAGVVSSFIHTSESLENTGIFIAHPIHYIIKSIKENQS